MGTISSAELFKEYVSKVTVQRLKQRKHKDNYCIKNSCLSGDCRVFTATCNNEYISEGDHCPVEPRLKLKIGTQVRLWWCLTPGQL